MPGFRGTRLWQTAFGGGPAASASEGPFFAQHLEGMRERAKQLTARISSDMPGYTQHDITHLDALWEIADKISGPDYALNSPEGFVFGAAILLHDAGMTLAAYPGGLADLKKTIEWQDAFALASEQREGSAATSDVETWVTSEVLRKLHARKAEELATQGWLMPGRDGHIHLIDNPELRRFYGPTIGRIAHSHWWSIGKLETELTTRLGAMPPYTLHSVDALKVACLLRTADVLHLDRRRAPTFMRALTRPGGHSELHWTFQEKLSFPDLEGEAVVFTAGERFTKEEAGAWWQAYDALSLADRELRDVDLLLTEEGRPRLAARRVAGADDAAALARLLPVSGWSPVETALRISDVPDIIETLGGEYLYGPDPNAALRELLQNARDAVEARRRIERRPADWGSITVALFEREGSVWLSVEDTGVGMSRTVLTRVLLDFGGSLWRSAALADEFPGLASSGMQAVGRFGIGFFSVFMLGDEVRVMTRRYDRGMADALALEFKEGLRLRPILAPAERSEAPLDGGTRVEIRLAHDPRQKEHMRLAPKSGDADESHPGPSSLPDLVAWLAPALDVDVTVKDFGRRSIALRANDWLTIAPEALAARIGTYKNVLPYAAAFMRQIASADGTIYGRAAVIPSETEGSGIFAIGGLRADSEDWFTGILVGSPMRAARDRAGLNVPRELLGHWATDQGRLVAASKLTPQDKVMIANTIISCGGEVGTLPIIDWRGQWMDARMLAEHCREATQIRILLGPPIFDDDEGFNTMVDESFEPADELGIIPIFKTISDGPRPPVLNLVAAIAEGVWGRMESRMDSLPIGTSGGLPVIRHVQLLRKV